MATNAQPAKPKNPNAGAFQSLKRPLGLLKAHKAAAFGAAISVFVVMAANLTVPLLVRSAIDEGVGKHDSAALALALGLLVAAAGLRGLFGFLQSYLAERASQGVAYHMRDALFLKIQKLSFSYFDQNETGQVLTRVTNDVDQVRLFISGGLTNIVQSIVMILVSAAVILAMDWKLALISLVTLVPVVLVLGRFTKAIRPIFIAAQQATGRMASVLRESLAGVRIVRAFGRMRHESARYEAVNTALVTQSIAATRASSNTFPMVMLFANLGTLAIVGFGGWQVMGNHLTIGTLLAFTSYLGFLLQPLMTLGFSAMMISRAGVSAGRIAEIEDAPLDVADAIGAHTLPPIQGEVTFDDVAFRYPGGERDVLAGVSFTVPAGETVAIVGTTGSGKSTLVHLLPRFYDVTGGAVRVDGHDVREVTLSSLRSQIAIVLQDPLLFGGTISQNIAYGNPNATREAIEAAAKAAMADGFIQALPDGYDTVIGERGVGLSGGQRQRLAIARAILVAPRLIILDDSTSAVDAETESAIRESLDALMREANRTCLVIAHRFSTVRDADRILVLDGGRLVAQGDHETLMRTSPVYQDIVGTQFSASEAAR